MSVDAVFEVKGNVAHSTAHAAGPWDPSMQHGGAPSALVAWVVENIPTAAPMQVARMTIDLLRPVPIAPLEIRSEVVREGKKIQLCGVSLFAGGKECVRASALKIRVADYPELNGVAEAAASLPSPAESAPIEEVVRRSSGFISGVEVRNAIGNFGLLSGGGPAACWFRSVRPIVAGEANTPLMRAALTSDFCNGVSSVLDRGWTFLNGDLSINFARMPVGEWIALDAETWIDERGVGIAAGKLADERGYFGRAVQSLVVEKR
ncbi:thioesterase family protein [Parvibaculum sedimenti]|uniref:Thioesterase family protein n=1 Tax=Parvibaculum sedimenti TaxID=2608632 RepID=A0A6N6VK10_9HYPH|nr:thioesterase family protein [Parvibaculum sedimenti]KAB7740233.1 thioesterase family protein [Parvibaculum sedimenti]